MIGRGVMGSGPSGGGGMMGGGMMGNMGGGGAVAPQVLTQLGIEGPVTNTVFVSNVRTMYNIHVSTILFFTFVWIIFTTEC
jgi:hypothetical protein